MRDVRPIGLTLGWAAKEYVSVRSESMDVVYAGFW